MTTLHFVIISVVHVVVLADLNLRDTEDDAEADRAENGVDDQDTRRRHELGLVELVRVRRIHVALGVRVEDAIADAAARREVSASGGLVDEDAHESHHGEGRARYLIVHFY